MRDRYVPPELAKARELNELLKARERKMRLSQMRGDLIDRAAATAAVFRLARQERDAWLVWPARVAADIAAELGVETSVVQTVLDRHVRAHLTQLGEMTIDLASR